MTRARELADLSNASVFTIDNSYNVGLGTETPDAKLDVIGIVSATSYYGDGSTLDNVTSTTINNNADNRLITGSGTANTLNGESTCTYDGATFVTPAATVGSAVTINSNGIDIDSGIVTATTFNGNVTGNISGATGDFTGNVSIGGTLTYEDVTAIDSVGVVTAGKGLRVTTEGIKVTAGISTFTSGIHAQEGINVTAGVGTFAGAITAGSAVVGTAVTVNTDGIITGTGIGVTVRSSTSFTKDATFGGALKESVTTSTNTVNVYNVDLINGNVHKFDTNGSGAGTVFITYNGGNNVNTYMATNETVSLSVIAKPNSAGYINAVQIDGTATGVTVEWSSDSAAVPSSGNDGAYDLYAFNIVKTASAAYLVFASRTKFD